MRRGFRQHALHEEAAGEELGIHLGGDAVLEELGLEVPTTWDELLAVQQAIIDAFSAQDGDLLLFVADRDKVTSPVLDGPPERQ